MMGAYLVFAVAVALAAAWVMAVASFIEPEWQKLSRDTPIEPKPEINPPGRTRQAIPDRSHNGTAMPAAVH